MKYVMESEIGARAIINHRLVDYYGGCGYFCFQTHPDVVQAACDASRKFGISSATTPNVYGTNPILVEFQEKCAQFFEKPNVFFYASGCFGTSLLLEGLTDEYEIIFIDNESHYSSRLGTALANKPVVLFEHRNPDDLRLQIHHHLKPSHRPMIVCDGIFPISGEISPIPQYLDVLDGIPDALFCIDDAHATGVIGEKGFGTYEYFGLSGERLYASGTLSKALGGHGGIICGNDALITKIKQKSILANACSTVPIPAAAATSKALEILHQHPELRKQLWDNVGYAKEGFRKLGFVVNHTPVPIICLNTNQKSFNAERIQQELFENNIAVAHVPEGVYTSVPKGGALRISIFSAHTHEQIDHLIDAVNHLI
ncbi:MAG: aminotransferase class I/II-fold pyridoxal phosphate-dependent enzyme [Candidatus Omnitrophota bacterium]